MCALKSLAQAKALTPQLLAVAQTEYDAWDESDADTYAGGGICHLIAEELASVLGQEDIESITVCCNFEQHVYVLCQLAQGVFSLDIPYARYERGAMFSWTKIPDVIFEADDLEWYQVDSDPERFASYLAE